MAVYCMENPVSYDLSCPICFEEYDILSVQRAPKLLLCLHTFCYGCTQQLWQADGTLECSLCRTVHYEVTLADLFDNPVILQHLRKKNEEEDLEFARTLDRELRTKQERRNASNATAQPRTNHEPPPAERSGPTTRSQQQQQPLEPPTIEPQPPSCRLQPPQQLDLLIPAIELDSVDDSTDDIDEIDSVDRIEDSVDGTEDSVEEVDGSADEVDFVDRVENLMDGLDYFETGEDTVDEVENSVDGVEFLDRVEDAVDEVDNSMDGLDISDREDSVHEVEDVDEVDDSVQIINDNGMDNEGDIFNLESPLFEGREDEQEWEDQDEEEEVFHSARGGFVSPSCRDEFSNDEAEYGGDQDYNDFEDYSDDSYSFSDSSWW